MTRVTVLAELALGDLLVGRNNSERQATLEAEGLADEAGLTWVLDQAAQLVHDDPRSTDELCQLVAAAAVRLGLVALQARSSYLRARVAADRGELRAGLALISEAKGLWQIADNSLAALRTDLGRMQILDDLGDHLEAITVGEALLEAVQTLNPVGEDIELARAIRAMATENLGAAFGFTGQHQRALDAYAEASSEYVALGMESETARPLGNRGIELLQLGRAREAVADLSAAAETLTVSGDRLFVALTLSHRARAHQQLGDFSQALTVLAAAREIFAGLGETAESNRLQLSRAETYLAIGLWAEAGFEANEAVVSTERAQMTHDTAHAYFLRALAELGGGDIEPAETSLSKAFTRFQRVGDQQHCVRVRQAQVEVVARRGSREAARLLADEVAVELAAGGWMVPLAWTQLRRIDLADDPAEVHRLLAEADITITGLGMPQLDEQYRLRRARLARRSGDLKVAEDLLQNAVDDLNIAARSLPDHALRTAFRASKLGAYDELIELLIDRAGPGDLERARMTSQQAKAATLRDLTSSSVGTGPQATASTTDELAMAESDLAATYLALQEADTPGRRCQLSERSTELQHRVSALRIRSGSVPDQSLMSLESAPDRSEVSANFGTKGFASTLEYHVLGADVVVFASPQDRSSRSAILTGAVPHIVELLAQLGHQWERFALGTVFGGRHHDMMLLTTRDLLKRLHDILIKPVLDDLGPEGGHLQIVPHRIIGQVPFHALFDGDQHLIEQWVITTAPVLTTRWPQPQAMNSAVVLAVPDGRAPAVAQEAQAIAALLPSATVLIGEEASSGRLAELAGHDLIHFACHGAYQGDNPLFSRLRLADRWVTSTDILKLDLHDALIVLSACESGQQGRAAEPVGLGWAFLAAGASGVVSTQWVVQDDVTQQLMAVFYQSLRGGSDPASAVRSAQLATAATHPHPFYWAAFTYLSTPDS